jgi:thiol-disulfide isomerase/thioredoxin
MKNKKIISWSLRIFIFLLFVVSAVAKMFPIWAFEKQLVDLGVASWCAAPYLARILLGIELSIGIGLLQPHFLKRFVIPATIALLLIFCAHLSLEMYKHGAMNGNCGCFGQLIPMTPLEAFSKNVLTIGLLIWLYRLTEENHKKSNVGVLVVIWSLSTLMVFVAFPFCPCAKAEAELPQATIQLENTAELVDSTQNKTSTQGPLSKPNATNKDSDFGPKQTVSRFAKLATYNGKTISIDQGKTIVCFFAPGCDHCQATAKTLAELSKKPNFPLVYVFFMDEEAEKIPEFFKYAGKEFPYKILDIPSFWTLIGEDGETPGVHVLWNGNIIKTFMGINENAFDVEKLKIEIQRTK